MLFIRLILLVSSVFLITSCQSAPQKTEDSSAAPKSLAPANVRVIDRPTSEWHKSAVWFAQDLWPNRWTKATYEPTGIIRNGETVILGGCLKAVGGGATFRSITFVSFDGMKTFREIQPFAHGSCTGDFVWRDKHVAGISLWSSAESFFGGIIFSEDAGASWQQTSTSTDVQSRVGVGPLSILDHRRDGKKSFISIEGSQRAGVFETSDNGKTLKWKRPLSQPEVDKLAGAQKEQQAQLEATQAPISEVWLDWPTGSIAFDPPVENPPRVAAE